MKQDGGPAFPVTADVLCEYDFGKTTRLSGMTLRAYFAAHAPAQRTDFTDYGAAAIVGREMPGYPTNAEVSEQTRIDYQIATAQFRIDLDVALRLRWADAMIEACSK